MGAERGDEPTGQGRADALRAAVDQAFEATAFGARSTRERAQEVADELAAAAGRVRELLDDLRPPTGDDVRALQRRVEALEARVAELESKP
jgi:polyhydroxyalkanoate synthesis regulator phasin